MSLLFFFQICIENNVHKYVFKVYQKFDLPRALTETYRNFGRLRIRGVILLAEIFYIKPNKMAKIKISKEKVDIVMQRAQAGI